MKRREFVKLSAAATAAVVCGPTVLAEQKSPVAPEMLRQYGRGVQWDKAPCRFCGTGCHVQIGVQDGKVVAVAGDQLAEVNKGLLCVKGYHSALALYGEDRLTTPMLRKDGKLEPVSWDEALDVIAQRIFANPAGFAFYGSGQWTIPEGYAANKFMKGGLANNHIDPNARLCMASAVTGFLSTYGVDEPASCYDDLDRCDVLIMWGNNMAEMHPVLFARVIDRMEAGDDVTLVDLGTRRTRTTERCQHYLEFKPQTDLAIANGILHLLVKDGTYNQQFVEKHCDFRKAGKHPLFGQAATWDEFKEGLEQYTPEYVEELSGVPADKIRWLSRQFANPKLRITSVWCMGVNQHTRGTAMNNLIHNVHLISGHFGREGDGPQSLTGQPAACGTVREVGTLAHALPGGRVVANPKHRAGAEKLWNLPAGRISPDPGYHTVKMFEQFSTATEKGGDIDTLWVQVTNPGQTLPNLHKLFYPSRKLPDKFLIVSDVYPTATTKHADLVLPSAMWIEKNGMYGNSERRTQQWFKMIEPPGQARDDCWQIVAVARRLHDLGLAGMKDKDGAFLFDIKDGEGKTAPVWQWENYYDVNVDEQLFEEYRGFTTMKHKNLAPYSEYVRRRGLRWPVVQTDQGNWKETRYRFVEGEDPFVEKGKGVQFYHSTSENDKAQLWIRPYEAPPEGPDDEFPFWLCTGRVLEHWHTGTMTMRVPQLRNGMPNAYVEVNRTDATAYGIANGQMVRVVTRRGNVTLPAWIDGRGDVPEGSLFVPFFDERLLVNEVTLDDHDPNSKQPDYKKCAARIVPVSAGGRPS